MAVELKIAAFGALLLLVHIFAAVHLKTKQYGREWNVGARDEALPPLNPVAGRLARAQANFLETFPIAIVALLGVVIADRTSAVDGARRVDLARCAHDLSAALRDGVPVRQDRRLHDQHCGPRHGAVAVAGRLNRPSRWHPTASLLNPRFMSDVETAEAPATAESGPEPPLSRRRVELHLPRLSPAAAAHQPARDERRRGLRLHDHAVEARRRPQAGRGADPHGGHPRCVGAYPPQRDVRPVQGEPPAAARGPGPAIPFDPRRDARLLHSLHREGRARGRRHHRLLRDGGEAGRVARDHRQLRQGFDAAGRGRPGRHARHDERPPDRRGGGQREVRSRPGEGRRSPRA